MKTFLIISSIGMFLGVLLGAFGAHGLRQKISADMLAIWNTGVLYHMLHCLGLAIIGLSLKILGDNNWLTFSGWALILGVIIFSGSLYLLAITGIRWLGAITPIGGLSFLVGWLCYAWAIYKSN